MKLTSAPASTPLLLVSVRDDIEARAALAGGCNILDVKEPRRGSLGMADVAAIASVIDAVGSSSNGARVPISAALGETLDWLDAKSLPELPAGLDYAKLGLAGLCDHCGWPAEWQDVRGRFEAAAAEAVQWVAVAYVDWKPARAPRPEAVIELAGETACGFVLFDTWNKSEGALLDRVSAETLSTWIEKIHRHGMRAALAGSLTVDVLSHVNPLRPDVIAIRGAACHKLDRNAAVCKQAVREFKQAMLGALPGPTSRLSEARLAD